MLTNFWLTQKSKPFRTIVRDSILITSLLGCGYMVYYANIRKQKGMKKLGQTFKNDILKKKLEKISTNFLYFSQFEYEQPTAVVFPDNHDEVEKMVKYANKYGFGVKTTQINARSQGKPFWLVDLKNIKHIDFDPLTETVDVGSGATIEDINDYLLNFGYQIPLKNEQKSINELIALDVSPLKDFLNQMTLVLGNGDSLQTGFKYLKKNSHHIIFNELFFGSNNDYGLVTSAVLSVQKIQKKHLKQLYLHNKNLEPILQEFNDCKNAVFTLQNSEIHIKHDCDIQIKGDSKSNNLIKQYIQFLQVRTHPSFFPNIFSEIQPFIEQEKIKAKFDKNNGDISIKIDKNQFDNQELKFLGRQIKNAAHHCQGIFLHHSNSEEHIDLKEKSIMREYGRNHLAYYKKIKSIMDPNHVLCNNNYIDI